MHVPIEELVGHDIRSVVMTIPRRLRKRPVQRWTMEYVDAAAHDATAAAEGGEHDMGVVGDVIVAAPKLHRVTTLPIDTTDVAVAALFNPALNCFVSVASRDVAVWTVDGGRRTDTYCSDAPSDATAACFDDRRRKLFVGRADGTLSAINLVNGAVMKGGRAPASVLRVVYHHAARCLVASCADGTLLVLDDEPQTALEPLRSMTRAHASAIPALAISDQMSTIVTGDTLGNVRVWDFQDLHLVCAQPRAATKR